MRQDVATIPAPTKAARPYFIEVIGESMFPVYYFGEYGVVYPGESPQPGDDALIELYDGGNYLKRFVKCDGGKIILRQFNPDCEFEVEAERVKSLTQVLSGNRYISRWAKA